MDFPNFIILGAAKAGTTAIYHYLNQHPQVYVTPLKETNFFALEGQTLQFSGPGDDDYVNRLSIIRIEDYRAQFEGVTTERAVGEASPLYLYHPKAAQNIRHYTPNVKLIVFVRNPVDRAFSAFLHLVRDQRETFTDFRQALAAEDARIEAGWEHLWHYKHMGLYSAQIQRYYDLFPLKKIHVFLYKDLRTDPVGLMRQLFQILGVEPSFVPDTSQRHNVTSDLPPERRPALLPEVRAELRDFFREDALRLQDLIGRDITHWLQESGSAQEAVP